MTLRFVLTFIMLLVLTVKVGTATIPFERVFIMTDFEKCIAKTLDIEKGFVDDPNDAGGATNFGVSLRFLQKLIDTDRDGYVDGDIDKDGDVDVDDIKKLTLDDVHRIMRTYFWNELPFIETNIPLSIKWKVFDISIHCSPLRAVKILQKALKIIPDGVWGIKSYNALQTANTDSLLNSISKEQMKYYSSIIVNRPANLKFLKNWTWRAFEQLEEI